VDMPSRPAIDIEQKFPADHAMRGEYEAAVATRDIKRLQLFIARHPKSELAGKASALVSKLKTEQLTPSNRY
jgi:hypothetical protein